MIVQIESTSGVGNVEAIAAVEGVDVLFVGPFDLAKSMDIQFGGEEHEAAIARTLKACKDNKKYAAIFCTSLIAFPSIITTWRRDPRPPPPSSS